MAIPRLMAMPGALIGAGFIALYVLLDWASYVQPFGPFGITPWNPGAGLGLVLVLVFGPRFLPLLFVAPLVAEIVVRRAPAPLTVNFAICAIIGGGYSAAAILLLRPQLGFKLGLTSMRDLLLLLGSAVMAAATVAVLLVLLLAGSGLINWADFSRAAIRYWVGDVIGIAVVAPFLLMLITRRELLRPSREGALQVASIAIVLAIVFAAPAGPRLDLFYLLFLPIVWIAVRRGLAGVTAGLVLTQVGLIVGIYLASSRDIDATAFQTLMLVLTCTGLATGLLVTERQHAELQLRLQQEEHARIARLGSVGELATSIAHEINQPLMAAGTYTRLVAKNLDPVTGSTQLAREAATKAVAQVERAAGVVRSLRTLARLGRNDAAPADVGRLVSSAIELVRPMLANGRIMVRQEIPDDLPNVSVDPLQIELVLINILRNSVEAMTVGSQGRGSLIVSATRPQSTLVEISVQDTGIGFTPDQVANLAAPFRTTKPDGLGIGLALSRSIVEAHGGRLWAAPCESGARVSFTVPVAEARP